MYEIFVLNKCARSNFRTWPVRLSHESNSTKDTYVYLLRMDYSFLHQHSLIIHEITTNFSPGILPMENLPTSQHPCTQDCVTSSADMDLTYVFLGAIAVSNLPKITL